MSKNEIFVYDQIGPEWAGMVGANSIKKALKELFGEEVTMRVNSPGGSVFEAMAIYNAIAEHGNVSAVIDGVAASAASYITLAAKSVSISENGLYMLHPVMGAIWGSIADVRKYLEMMEAANTQTKKAYQAKSPDNSDKIGEMFEAETWLTPEQAVEYGFASEIGQKFVGPVPKVPENLYKNTPTNLLAKNQKEVDDSRIELRNYHRELSMRMVSCRLEQLKNGCLT